MLKTLFARVTAKVKLVSDYRQLVIDIHKQEEAVEALRHKKEELKFNADIYEAVLYLSKKGGGEKVTEAQLKAIVETDEEGQGKRVEVMEAEHELKLASVELTHLYNNLQATKLDLTA